MVSAHTPLPIFQAVPWCVFVESTHQNVWPLLSQDLKRMSKCSSICGMDICTLIEGKKTIYSRHTQTEESTLTRRVSVCCLQHIMRLTMLSLISPRQCFFCNNKMRFIYILSLKWYNPTHSIGLVVVHVLPSHFKPSRMPSFQATSLLLQIAKHLYWLLRWHNWSGLPQAVKEGQRHQDEYQESEVLYTLSPPLLAEYTAQDNVIVVLLCEMMLWKWKTFSISTQEWHAVTQEDVSTNEETAPTS